jgi:hypothetical protein
MAAKIMCYSNLVPCARQHDVTILESSSFLGRNLIEKLCINIRSFSNAMKMSTDSTDTMLYIFGNSKHCLYDIDEKFCELVYRI